VDLFSGCGGLTVGFWEAARRANMSLRVALAVDSEAVIAATFERNFPEADFRNATVEDLFPGRPGRPLTPNEENLRRRVGEVHILCGGPPCQGHSDLNNHTRRRDERNGLYLRMARAAEVLDPRVIVIENVQAVEWDEGDIVTRTNKHLVTLGYEVETRLVDLSSVGVPQHRRRHILIATTGGLLSPSRIFDYVSSIDRERSVEWAIGDLLNADSAESTFDSASIPSPANEKRIDYLFDKDLYELPDSRRPPCHRNKAHSYRSVYGRMRWDRPAPTITTGYGSMGQGRFVHPLARRTITPHEAARLQTFPDWFSWGNETKRGTLATMIGNAVPPLLALRLGEFLIPHLVPELPLGTIEAPSLDVSKRMRATRRRDTDAELLLRRELHRRGLRYRVDQTVPGCRGKVDILFSGPKLAVFVDGCFWHRCPEHATNPVKNGAWWSQKLSANVERDLRLTRLLRDEGYQVMRFWEHEDAITAADTVEEAVRLGRSSGR
jgi:DNA (cytosine-5)-methyltransferase 1